MYNGGQSESTSLHFALYQVFKHVASVIRYLPNGIASPFLVLLRVLFVAILGFAAWVRSFSDSSLGLWLAIGIAFCALVHLYLNRPCYYPEGKCAIEPKKDVSVPTEWLQNEVEMQKNMFNTLEQVKMTLESKSRLEQEAETVYDRWKNQLRRSDEKLDALRQQLSEVEEEKSSLEDQLQQKIRENVQMQSSFERNLNMLNDSLENMRTTEFAKKRLQELANMEKLQRLEDENTVLRATVEALTRQRKSLSDKHSTALREMKQLAYVTKDLEEQLSTKEKLENLEKEKINEVQKLTRQLSSSLSNAKGKLSRAKNTLTNDREKNSRKSNSMSSPKI